MQNDEIKKILDRLEKIGFYASVPKELAYMTTNITPQECKTILDYITNLQQENERLKEENKYLDELRNANYSSWQDSLSRIEKAVEYIKEDYERNQEVIEYCSFDEFYKKLLNILNGRSDE